jgi:hypothetical protein
MRRGIFLGIVVIGLAYLYVLALVYGIGVVAAQSVLSWWPAPFSTRRSAALSWILFSHFVVVLLVTVPFAWIIARAYGRFSLAVSFAISLVIWSLFEAPLMLDAFRSAGIFSKGIWFADTIKFVGSLPLLVLLFRRLPSNNRFGGIDISHRNKQQNS